MRLSVAVAAIVVTGSAAWAQEVEVVPLTLATETPTPTTRSDFLTNWHQGLSVMWGPSTTTASFADLNQSLLAWRPPEVFVPTIDQTLWGRQDIPRLVTQTIETPTLFTDFSAPDLVVGQDWARGSIHDASENRWPVRRDIPSYGGWIKSLGIAYADGHGSSVVAGGQRAPVEEPADPPVVVEPLPEVVVEPELEPVVVREPVRAPEVVISGPEAAAGLPGYEVYRLSVVSEDVAVNAFDLEVTGNLYQAVNQMRPTPFKDDQVLVRALLGAHIPDTHLLIDQGEVLSFDVVDSPSELSAVFAFKGDSNHDLNLAQIVLPTGSVAEYRLDAVHYDSRFHFYGTIGAPIFVAGSAVVMLPEPGSLLVLGGLMGWVWRR